MVPTLRRYISLEPLETFSGEVPIVSDEHCYDQLHSPVSYCLHDGGVGGPNFSYCLHDDHDGHGSHGDEASESTNHHLPHNSFCTSEDNSWCRIEIHDGKSSKKKIIKHNK